MIGRKGKTLIVIILLLVLSTSILINIYINIRHDDPGSENRILKTRRKSFLLREEINTAISRKMNQGKTDHIVEIYTGITGNPELVKMIIEYALSYDIPVSLLFSIIYVESSFNPEAVNRNANGTYDYGLMALNSRTFSNYTREQLIDPEINLKLGCEYLVKLKKRYKTWGEAVIHYNGLYARGAGSYLVRVMEMERELEKLYNERLL
ncbi:MAG: lytic transglycosylase domain-containing protein [Spirochaetota bacterium]